MKCRSIQIKWDQTTIFNQANVPIDCLLSPSRERRMEQCNMRSVFFVLSVSIELYNCDTLNQATNTKLMIFIL